MEYISDIYKNVILYIRLFFVKLSCRTNSYEELHGSDFDDIESINFNRMQSY
jgi:hypothetical protein